MTTVIVSSKGWVVIPAEIRKKYAHPFYWAPFVLVGKYV